MLKLFDPGRNRHAGAVFTASVLCGPAALGLAGWAAYSAHTKQPMPQQTYIHLNEVTKQVELVGDQVVRLALTGSGETDRQTLAAKVVDPRAVALPTVPWNVISSHVIDVQRRAVEPDSAEWEVVVQVGYAAPGTGTVRFADMSVLVLSSGGAYKAAALPMPVAEATVPMQVGPGYTISVDPHSGIGTAISNFADAFYVKGSDMGRYVTGDFSGKPIVNSPFTSTTVQAILARSALPAAPKPGDTVDVLATIRGAASESTWLNMQVPMRVAFTDQRQWAVQSILDRIDVGQIVHQ